MIILGIDPGYAIVGYGAISFKNNIYKPLYFGAITTNSGVEFPIRLEQIYREIDFIIKKVKPDAVSIEKLYFNNNQKTVIHVSEARGVIILAAKLNNIPIYEYTPLQVKTIVTGYGQAHKPQVMEMTRRLLRLKELPKPDDTADALAIAICHAQSSGTNLKRGIMDLNAKGNSYL